MTGVHRDTTRTRRRSRTPALAAGVTDHVWTIEELMDAVLGEDACKRPDAQPPFIPRPAAPAPAPLAMPAPSAATALRFDENGQADCSRGPQSPGRPEQLNLLGV